MQRSAATPTTQSAAPFFSSLFGGGASDNSNNTASSPTATKSPARSGSRPATRDGDPLPTGSPRQPNLLQKDRKPSFSRKPSFNFISSPSRGSKRRGESTSEGSAAPANGRVGQPLPEIQLQFDTALGPPPPSEPIARSPIAEGFSKMLSRGAVTPVSGYPVQGSSSMLGMNYAQSTELAMVHQHIQETATKRISTLEYLRKAHEGRIYWFNTLLFDKPDLQRMPYFDSRKLGRRATNYLLLGISLPAVIDLNSNTPTEFLRSLNTLLTEFDSFQQIHSENGTAPSSLTRARIPQMFRRAAAPVSKGRRSSSAAGRDAALISAAALATAPSAPSAPSSSANPISAAAAADPVTGLYSLEQVDSNSHYHPTTPANEDGPGLGGPLTTIPTNTTTTASSVMAFAANEVDLLPGEEYTLLLTPTLPFDPDFFETFATLCDVLIDTYTRLLSLVPTARECTGSVGELFAKCDGKVRKLLVQGVVKEFEDAGRGGAKAEVAGVGRVVLSGLM